MGGGRVMPVAGKSTGRNGDDDVDHCRVVGGFRVFVFPLFPTRSVTVGAFTFPSGIEWVRVSEPRPLSKTLQQNTMASQNPPRHCATAKTSLFICCALPQAIRKGLKLR